MNAIRTLLAVTAVAGMLHAAPALAQDSPSIRFEAPSLVAEGDTGLTPVTITWQLTPASTSEVRFTYSVPADEELSPDWQSVAPTVVTIAVGSTTGSFTVNVFGDELVEGDWIETMTVRVTDISGALSDGQSAEAEMSILIQQDDDALPKPWIVRDDHLVTRFLRHEIDPRGNDTAAWEDMQEAVVTIVRMPVHGDIGDNGFGTPTYTPHAGYVGPDSLRFRICRTPDECRESEYSIEVVPLAGASLYGQGAAGFERFTASGLPAMPSPRYRATPLVPEERSSHVTSADFTPATPWDSDDGVEFVLRTIPASGGVPVAYRIDAGGGGSDHELLVGFDDDGDGLPSEDEVQCRDIGECRLRVVVGDAPVSYWMMLHNLAQDVRAAGLGVYEVPLIDGDGTLTVTGPGVIEPDGTAELIYSWDDRTMFSDQSRRGYLRLESDDGVPAGEVAIDASYGLDFWNPDALPLRPGSAVAMALPGGRSDVRTFIDVPAGATRLTVSSQSDGNVDFYVIRRTTPMNSTVVTIADAPALSAAAFVAAAPGGDETVVIEGPSLLPGRWYVVPSVPGDDAVAFTLTATIEGTSPVVRPGSYFNESRPGSGLFLYPAGDQLTGLWYTYYDTGRPTWYYMQATAPDGSGVWHSPIYRAAWDGDDRTLTAVGQATLTPMYDDFFVLSYVLDGETGSQPFEALGRGCPMHGGAPLDISNQWFDPARAGTGYSVQMWDNYEYFAAYVYDARGEPLFLAAELDRFGADEATLTLQRLTGVSPTTRDSWFQAREDVGTFVRRVSGGTLDQVEIDAVWSEDDGSEAAWSQIDDVQPLGLTQGCAL